MVKCFRILRSKQMLMLFLFLINPLQTYSQELPNSISKRGGIAFRTDDNQQLSRYQEYAALFDRYNQKFNFAINLGREDITTQYLSGIKQIQSRGHEMMDHTPNHMTHRIITPLNPDYYLNHPGVFRILGNEINLKHADVEISSAKRSGYANINGNRITLINGLFSNYSKNDCYLYFQNLNQLVFINESSGWIDSVTVEVRDFWNKTIDLGSHQNIKFYNFDIFNIHLTTDAIKVLAEETVRLANYYNIERPYSWIQPGGYHPQLYSNEIKQGAGSVGFTSAGVFPNPSLKVFNEYNPNKDKQFGMNYGDFHDESWTLAEMKEFIADRIAKHQVVFGESHFSNLLGGWSGFLDRTEKLIQWCVANNIPIRTYSEWADILYHSTPDPYENIFPPINIDLDGNNIPDGYDQGSVLKKNDGYPSNANYCFAISSAGKICSITNLGGVEKGENDFEIWTKGTPGNFIEVNFKIGSNSSVYKFPAENSQWTRYNISQSLNGNTSLNIPNSISQVNIVINCSDYSSGEVKISGFKLSKASGTSEYLNISPTSLSFSSTGENLNIAVFSNLNWNATTSADWIQISPTNGTNDKTINVLCSSNTNAEPRSTIISISGGGLTRTISVNQSGIASYLNITPSNQNVSFTSGATTFSVSSNSNWSIEENSSWLTVSPMNSSGNGIISVNLLENKNPEQRIGSISVVSNGIINTVTITQSAAPYLSASPTNRIGSYYSGTNNFSISSNIDWVVTEDVPWLSVEPASGSNSGVVTITREENKDTAQRIGVINISGSGITQTVTITQLGVPPYLVVSPTEVLFSNNYDSLALTVNSNINWTVNKDVSWLAISTSEGNYEGTITVTITENPNSVERRGTISISGGGIVRVVSIIQKAKPLLEVMPGEQNVNHGSDSTIFTIESNSNWVVEEELDWLTVLPSTGENNGAIEVMVTENPSTEERRGTISISGGGIVRVVSIIQKAKPLLEVMPGEQNVNHGSDSTIFTIQSNDSWVVEEEIDWLTVIPESGVNDGLISVIVNENPDIVERKGIIRIRTNELSKVVSVVQFAKNFLDVFPTAIEVTADSGSTKVIINSNINWHAEELSDWFSINKTFGSGKDTLLINYDINPRIKARTGLLTVQGDEFLHSLVLTQNEAQLKFAISSCNKTVNPDSGKFIVDIETNAKWEINNNCDWIQVSPDSGDGNSSINLIYKANLDSISRISRILFSCDTVKFDFELIQTGLDVFNITVSLDSSIFGAVFGNGKYISGSQVQVKAIPNQGFLFNSWVENDSVVSTDSIYKFIIKNTRQLIAKFSRLTNIEDVYELSSNFELFQNFPNPFNPNTKIRFAIPSFLKEGVIKVTLKVFDILGNEIETLIDEEKTSQYYEIDWLAHDLPSGIYFYQLRAGDFISSKKMVLLK